MKIISKQVRQKIEKYIYTLLTDLDDDGTNKKQYETMFKSLSDKAFTNWLLDIKAGKTSLFFYVNPTYIELSNKQLFQIAKKRNVKLFHHLRIINNQTGRLSITDPEYLVLQLPVRRLRQYLKKKYNMPKDDTQVSAITGQVINESKASKMSLVQTRLLMSKNLDSTMKEFINVRGGNLEAYYEAKNHILKEGTFRLSELAHLKSKPYSTETVSVFLKSIMLDNNLA